MRKSVLSNDDHIILPFINLHCDTSVKPAIDLEIQKRDDLVKINKWLFVIGLPMEGSKCIEVMNKGPKIKKLIVTVVHFK